jgi:hypothetical protein
MLVKCQTVGTCPRANSIAALDYITAPSIATQIDSINFSIGGAGCNEGSGYALAFQRVVNAGVPIAVAAGNDNALASAYQPACYSSVLTVGSIDSGDTKSFQQLWRRY